MKIVIQKACVIDRLSPHHQQVRDILIEDGHIKAIQPEIDSAADSVIRHEGLHVSPGWVDVFSHFCDPGLEHKETLRSGAQAAAAGGYTDVFVIPNTKPVVDSKSQVEYIRAASASLPVCIRPIGALTKGLEGKDLAEMYDMRNSGAIAFSDGTHPVQSSGLLLKGLQYVKTFDGVIIQVPDDKTVGANGLMNEGIVSTRLGLPGKPMMAEELIIDRDLQLLRYTGSRIHFTGVSSPRSVEAIRNAKKEGLSVSCSVTPFHLFFSDDDLINYDTNLKIFPPLRDKTSRQILQEAVLDGTIDCIASHHLPHEFDSKVVEFEYARAGMTSLETVYAAIRTALPALSPERTVELLSSRPREIFGLHRQGIKEGAPASLSLFNPAGLTFPEAAGLQSKSKNSPFLGKELKGQVLGIINQHHLIWHPQKRLTH